MWPKNATRNITLYLKPKDNTVLLQPQVPCKDPLDILFVVPSSISNFKERQAIRNTWGKWVYKTAPLVGPWELGVFTRSNEEEIKAEDDKKWNMKLIFLLGVNSTQRVNKEILQEQNLYGDIVVQDFIDVYVNLTLKSLFMLKWVKDYCPQSKFIMKVDDDIFINVPNLHHSLKDKFDGPPLLLGCLICNAGPIHSQWSKWYVPSFMYDKEKYPNYLSGTAYVISQDIIEHLFMASLDIPYFHLEDVFTTGMCSRAIGIRPQDNIGFSYQKRAISPCLFRQLVMGHDVSPANMILLWNLLHQPKALSSCGHLKDREVRSFAAPQCQWP